MLHRTEVIFTDFAQFSKIAPYLVNPLVLIGLCLFLLFGTYQVLLKAELLVPLSQNQSSAAVRLILKHGFSIAILIVVLGFVYAGYRAYRDTIQQGPITQQSDHCSSNIDGNNNKADVPCPDKAVNQK